MKFKFETSQINHNPAGLLFSFNLSTMFSNIPIYRKSEADNSFPLHPTLSGFILEQGIRL